MVGILIDGDNHFIVRGPKPDAETARALVRHWSVIRIGSTTPVELENWRISSKESREDLEWAIVVGSEKEMSPAVKTLLAELEVRGVAIDKVMEYL